MKIKRSLMPRQLLHRIKLSSAAVLTGLLFTSVAAQSAAMGPEYTGPYHWQGKEFKFADRKEFQTGYVEEYNNLQQCSSPVIPAGIFVATPWLYGWLSVFVLLYTFIGVAVVTDILMEAIIQITSETELHDVKNIKGEDIIVPKAIWTSSIANITLLAFGTSAPEIMLCFMSTVVSENDNAGVLGPLTIIGSASFNLLVVGGISIICVGSTTGLRIDNWAAFLTTFGFATFAYAWYFLIVNVITPQKIDFWEALLTLLFFPLMVLFVWTFDRRSASNRIMLDEDDATRLIYKHMLQAKAMNIGKMSVLDAACGNDNGHPDRMYEIQSWYRIVLQTDNLAKVTLDQMIAILEPNFPVERMEFRRGASGTNMDNKKGFCTVVATGHSIHHQWDQEEKNPNVGWKSKHYMCAETGGFVALTVVKKISEDYSFWVRTGHPEDTAMPHSDYKPKKQLVTMRAEQKELDIEIHIVDDDCVEPDEDFRVMLMEAENENMLLVGNDVISTVTIVDNEGPGIIGFKDAVVCVRPLGERGCGKVDLILERTGGADGDASVQFNTSLDHLRLETHDGRQQAVEDIDFVTVQKKEVKFSDGQSQATVSIRLPNSSLYNSAGQFDPRARPVSFVAELSQPNGSPQKPIMSKRNFCIVDIGQPQKNWREVDQRRQNLQYMLHDKDHAWSDNFRLAMMCGPTVDEYGRVFDIGFGEVFWQFLAMPWKLVFSIIPPVNMCNAIPTFILCMASLGFLIYVMVTMSVSIGCNYGISPCVQACLFISVGVALPELSTSLRIARKSSIRSADAILGSVSGANAISIFVGLGFAWTVRILEKWHNSNDWSQSSLDFGPDKSIDLSFSIFLFMIASLTYLVVMCCRRKYFGGELGGSWMCKWCSGIFLILIWFSFAMMNIANCADLLGRSRIIFSTELSVVLSDIDVGLDSEIQLSSVSDHCSLYNPSMPKVEVTSGKGYTDGIEIDWNYSEWTTFGRKIDYCKVEIALKGSDQWFDLSTVCDCEDKDIFAARKCAVSHIELVRDYHFENCDRVSVRVAACSSDHQCCGRFSESSVDIVQVQGCPAPFQIEPHHIADDHLSLQWNAFKDVKNYNAGDQCRKFETYQIDRKFLGYTDLEQTKEVFEGLAGFKEGDQLKDMSYRDDTVKHCAHYLYRVRMKNRFCHSEYSNYLPLQTKCRGPVPTGLTVKRVHNCALSVNWKGPETDRYTLMGYRVFVQSAAGGRKHPMPNCSGHKTHCHISMYELAALPNKPKANQKSKTMRVIVEARDQKGQETESAEFEFSDFPGPTGNPKVRVKDRQICLDWAYIGDPSSHQANSIDYGTHPENTRAYTPTSNYPKSHGHGPGDNTPHEHQDQHQRASGRIPGQDPNYRDDHAHHDNRRLQDEETMLEGPMYSGDSGDPSALYYEVAWAKGDEFKFERLVKRQAIRSFCQSNLDIGCNYRFKVRAVNQCGPGPWSLTVSRRVSTKPDPPVSVQSNSHDCVMSVYWKAPEIDGGADINAYKVQVRTKNTFGQGQANFMDIETCNNEPETLQCTFRQKELVRTHGLEMNDPIVVRVLAKNYNGWSKPSQEFRNPKTLQMKPQKIGIPHVTPYAGETNAVRVIWDSVNANPQITRYELFNGQRRIYNGLQTQYIVRNMQVNSDYKFTVKAANMCGVSTSPQLEHAGPCLQGQVPELAAEASGCDLRITWQAPLNCLDRSPVQRYAISVLALDGKYYTPNQMCGASSSARVCTISMALLQRSPYGLPVGQKIIIRAAALNENGWGLPKVVTTKVNVMGRPERVGMPTVAKIVGNEAHLQWDKLGDATYVVEYKTANEFSEWSSLHNDGLWHQNNAVASSLTYGASYFFRVKARNACGIGAASDYVKVDVPSPPRSPRRPTVTQVRGCSVVVAWGQISSTSLIVGYQVEIAGHSGKWYAPNMCIPNQSQPNSLQCTISMDSLIQDPFLLPQGTSIQARVRAINKVGRSDPSPQSVDNPVIDDLPSKMGTASIQLISRSDKMIQLNWTPPLFDQSKLNTGEDYAYELFWDAGSGGTYMKLTDVRQTQYSVYGMIREGTAYRFKVRTRYPCGSGPDSNELVVNADGSSRSIDDSARQNSQPNDRSFQRARESVRGQSNGRGRLTGQNRRWNSGVDVSKEENWSDKKKDDGVQRAAVRKQPQGRPRANSRTRGRTITRRNDNLDGRFQPSWDSGN